MTLAAPAWTHTHRAVLAGSPARVFTALTAPAELRRWFAEHVEIDPRPGGAFRFWGKHTYGNPARSESHQQLTCLEPGRTLAFTWRFEASDSEVAIELEPAPGAGAEGARTKFTLEHRFFSGAAGPDAAELIGDLWRMTIGNLAAHLHGGEGIVLPDYSDPHPGVRLSRLIAAPPERVFQALVDPATLNQWIAAAAVVEPRVGGRYVYGWEYDVHGRRVVGGPTHILEFVPNERLVTDWPDWRGNPSKPPTRVAWSLQPAAAKTRLTLVHDGFPRAVDISDYPFGWARFLDRLQGVVEG